MQPRVRHFADGVEIVHVGARIEVRHHAAATVVGRRHHGDGLSAHIDAEFHAAFHDVGKMLAQERLGLVGNIQIYAVQAAFFHLVVDGARHHVARRKFGALVVGGHEARAVG